ncbi:nitrogen fixation protein NifZ [Paraburkholderia atlantica]|uniref:Nitrogen fixation protein NifZ n=2 Tax=Paraburkholderia TaxID=1822464 RepID=A0A7W8LCW5_9BURK|nr:nitrogen fixation protein NifZ [Paraburkholderia youngii]MBB5420446.1 nitrogen fixation protein NifZ [Paraburkholderia atlantica]MBB5428893.1 nitrogen fixation protein NifZ [Paraburkholderia atlantica]MPW09987.1 nitrogen fixation protein NifZ [Paraburkholderia atlantica]NUY34341.1 nitrogen fixation protein NifZ [Paraburkholderia atlantica]
MTGTDNDDLIELTFAPRFSIGERVASRFSIRNDGTYAGKALGESLVSKGDVGYVIGIETFLQRFYIYAVHFVEIDHRVGMRAKELCTLDHLPHDVLARLGEHAADLCWIGLRIPEGTDHNGTVGRGSCNAHGYDAPDGSQVNGARLVVGNPRHGVAGPLQRRSLF